MSEAKEYHIHLLEWHLVGELQIRITNQAFMDIADGIAGIALAVGKDNLSLWMVEQQSDQFSTRIACSTKNPHSDPPRGEGSYPCIINITHLFYL